jgi:hypothetical protein
MDVQQMAPSEPRSEMSEGSTIEDEGGGMIEEFFGQLWWIL